MDFNLESVVGITGLACLGVIVTAWDRSRQTLFKLFGFILQEAAVWDGWLVPGIYDLQSKYGVRITRTPTYSVFLGYAVGSLKQSHVLCRTPSGVIWFWYKRSLVAFTPDKDNPIHKGLLRYPRWVNIEQFLAEAMNSYRHAMDTSFCITVHRGISEKESSGESKLERNEHPLDRWKQLSRS